MAETVDWVLPDPRMEAIPWFRDPLHVPHPLPALSADAWQIGMRTFMGNPNVVVRGYGYMGLGPGTQPVRLETAPQADPGEAWRDFYLPRTRAICERIRTDDYRDVSAIDLAIRLPELMLEAGVAWAYTMAPLGGVSGPLERLIAFITARLGEDGSLLGMTVLQGNPNESSSAGLGLEALSRVARRYPGVAEALRAHRFDAIASADGGAEFEAALRAYLAEYGRGNHTWFELHNKTWEEDPTIPLEMVARFLDDPVHGPVAAQKRAADARVAAIAEVEGRLPDGPAREEFRELIAAAADYVPVIEERARWQLAASASLRAPMLALGAKLVAAGYLDEADDVFQFHTDELSAIASGAFDGESRKVATARKADLGAWVALEPPISLGAPLPPGFRQMGMMAKMFGFAPLDGEPVEGVIRGQAASRGTARGRARVITELDDADRLEAGDVLVCIFTAPPWTPLFAIASAVVTDAGGVLSHAAIAAREYGIPCVAATQDGTRRIQDGAMVEVDGGAGTVTVLG